jgi:hypothetical protein
MLEDDPDHVTEKLLTSAQEDDPSERTFERTAAALGVIGAAGLVSAPAAAQGAAVALKASAVSKLGGMAALKSLGFGLTAGLLVAGGAAIVSRITEPASQREPMPAVAPVVKTAPASSHSSPVSAPAPAATASALPTAPEPTSRTPGSAIAPPPRRPQTIASEIAALDGARSALQRQDPQAALRALDELERGGTTALGPEAAVIRAEALLARGDAAAAGALARAFIAENPRSPHVERMREIAASAR